MGRARGGEDELKGVEGRRVILVFTDGDDTESRSASLGKVIDRARAEEVMIYAIGLESQYFNGQRMVRSKPDGGLRKIADETGGGYFELSKTADLAPTFTRVAQELHSQYVLGFTPNALDGKVHKLAVRMKQPGMTARARASSYLATSTSPINRRCPTRISGSKSTRPRSRMRGASLSARRSGRLRDRVLGRHAEPAVRRAVRSALCRESERAGETDLGVGDVARLQTCRGRPRRTHSR